MRSNVTARRALPLTRPEPSTSLTRPCSTVPPGSTMLPSLARSRSRRAPSRGRPPSWCARRGRVSRRSESCVFGRHHDGIARARGGARGGRRLVGRPVAVAARRLFIRDALHGLGGTPGRRRGCPPAHAARAPGRRALRRGAPGAWRDGCRSRRGAPPAGAGAGSGATAWPAGALATRARRASRRVGRGRRLLLLELLDALLELLLTLARSAVAGRRTGRPRRSSRLPSNPTCVPSWLFLQP